jgi:RimJ/RimL family protein N-acetyltransferase
MEPATRQPPAASDLPYPDRIPGEGLELRPWDEELVRQMATWGERGFPYSAFDMGYLRNPEQAKRALSWAHELSPHRHFVAVEEGVAVGRASVNLRDDAGLYVWAVHVPPEHEGRGVCRRMLSALLAWLEERVPGRGFVLSANAFAERAHRAYYALGFETAEKRWQFDPSLAEELWQVPAARREPLMPYFRFHNGHWEVRTFVMRRPSRTSPGGHAVE